MKEDIQQYKDPDRVEGDAIQMRNKGIVFHRNGASVLLNYQRR